MDERLARQRYHQQKASAKRRGIAWELTYSQWREWWGDDLDRRGPFKDCLTMQRPKDEGPYKLGNIRKGTPKENTRTWVAMKANRGELMAPPTASIRGGRVIGADLENEGLGYASVWARYYD